LLEPMRSLIQSATASGMEIQIDLVGHSDTTGGERTNAPLSERERESDGNCRQDRCSSPARAWRGRSRAAAKGEPCRTAMQPGVTFRSTSRQTNRSPSPWSEKVCISVLLGRKTALCARWKHVFRPTSPRWGQIDETNAGRWQ
jgi:hypothetical protein